MNRIINLALTLLSFSFFTSCASMQLKRYSGPIQKEFVEQTKLKQSEAFTATEVYLAKWLVNSNYAIKVRDKDAGRLVAKIRYPCKGIKRPDVLGGLESTDVDVNLDASFKDNKVKYLFEITGFQRDFGAQGMYSYYIAEAEGQEAAVTSCFLSLKDDLLGNLNSTTSKNW